MNTMDTMDFKAWNVGIQGNKPPKMRRSTQNRSESEAYMMMEKGCIVWDLKPITVEI